MTEHSRHWLDVLRFSVGLACLASSACDSAFRPVKPEWVALAEGTSQAPTFRVTNLNPSLVGKVDPDVMTTGGVVYTTPFAQRQLVVTAENALTRK